LTFRSTVEVASLKGLGVLPGTFTQRSRAGLRLFRPDGLGFLLPTQAKPAWVGHPAGAPTAGGTSPASVLLQHPNPGARPANPALDHGRALDFRLSFKIETVKHVSRQTVEHVPGLDTKDANEWGHAAADSHKEM